MDYLKLYNDNENFKKYVDRYCVKHQVSVENALKHVIVKAYGDQVETRAKEIVVTKVDVGCGGC